MTQHTDERADFEAAYAAKLRQVLPKSNADRMVEWCLSRKGDGYEDQEVDAAWWGYQKASRRAPVAQVPKDMTSMVDAAMVEMKDYVPPLRRSDCHRLILAALAAAPQPPEEAPVKMPEPFAYVEHHKAGDNLWFDHPGGNHSPLYTEQQVRDLLAQHNIT